jgi:hypothetical protein
MSDLDEVSLVLSPTERYLNPRQLQDYRAEREACIRWLFTSGKDWDRHRRRECASTVGVDTQR